MTTGRIYIAAGAALAGLGVGLGAFGAHALKNLVSPEMLAVFETGVRYQMYHSLGLIGIGLALGQFDSKALRGAGIAFCGGIFLFSGSLYGLAAGMPRWTGAITPLGGIGFIAGWALFTAGVLRSKSEPESI